MDKREDTGNYYPGGTVVTGVPQRPGGGGSSVEVVPPSVDGAGKAADAKAVYDALDKKIDKSDVPFKLVEKSQDQQLDDRAYNHIIGDVVATAGKWSAESETWEGEKETNPINPDSIGIVKDEGAYILQWKPGAEDINDVDELPLSLLDESGTPKNLGSPDNIPTGRMKLQLCGEHFHWQSMMLPPAAKFIVDGVGPLMTERRYTNATVSFANSSGEQITVGVSHIRISKTVDGYNPSYWFILIEGWSDDHSYNIYKEESSDDGGELIDTSVEKPISVWVIDYSTDEEFSGTLVLHDNGTISGLSCDMGGTVSAPIGLPDKNGEYAGTFSCSEIATFLEIYLDEEEGINDCALGGLVFYGSVGPLILGDGTFAYFYASDEDLRGFISGDPPSVGTEIPLRSLFFEDEMNYETPDVSAYVSYAPGAITLIPPDPKGEKVSRQFGVVLDGPVGGTVKFQGAETVADVSINSKASRTVLRVTEPIKNAFVVVKEAERL